MKRKNKKDSVRKEGRKVEKKNTVIMMPAQTPNMLFARPRRKFQLTTAERN